MKKLKRLVMAGLFIGFALLVSCTNNNDNNRPDETPGSSELSGNAEAAEPADGIVSMLEERARVPDNIAEEDMEGMRFRILTRDYLYGEFFSEELTGNVVQDAIHLRNRRIEERFNIEFVSLLADRPATAASITAMAGDDAHDLVVDNMVFLASSALAKPYIDLQAVSTIDLSQIWFLQDAVNELSVNNRLYILPGEAATTLIEQAYIYYFNKSLIADLHLENPYRLVLEGRWTLDKFSEIIRGLYVDLDGDGQKSAGDFFGFASFNLSHPVAYTYSSGMRITRNNADGIPEFAVPSERLFSNFDKVFNLLVNNPDVFGATASEQHIPRNMFVNRQAAFISDIIGVAEMFRGMNDDFGIVPFPKYDEAQERYFTFVDGYASMMAVPATVRYPERIGKIITALNAESWKTVIPRYYTAIKVQFLRDDESVQVLDMLLDGRVFDFGYIYDNWQGYGFYMWNLISSGNNNIASYFERRASSADANLANVLQSFE